VNEARATIARRSSTLIGRCQCCRNPWHAMQLPCVVQIFWKMFSCERGMRTTLKPLRPASYVKWYRTFRLRSKLPSHRLYLRNGRYDLFIDLHLPRFRAIFAASIGEERENDYVGNQMNNSFMPQSWVLASSASAAEHSQYNTLKVTDSNNNKEKGKE
jgi:hypothetical protein